MGLLRRVPLTERVPQFKFGPISGTGLRVCSGLPALGVPVGKPQKIKSRRGAVWNVHPGILLPRTRKEMPTVLAKQA